jgi:hypothetical protein
MNLRNDIPYQAYVPALAARSLGGLTTFVRTTAQPEAMISALRAKLREDALRVDEGLGTA